MLIRRGRYVAELFPRVANVSPEENIYRIVVSETGGQPTGEDYLAEAYEHGLEAAKAKAEQMVDAIASELKASMK